jgi:RNase P/RNase MRP subunit POP5
MVKLFRKRYIAFKIIQKNGQIAKEDFIQLVRNAFLKEGKDFYREARPWMIRFEGTKGILRCDHKTKDKAIELLNRMKFCNHDRADSSLRVETVGTSGTIKRCIENFYSRM